MISLGSLALNVKIRYHYLIVTALLASVINVGLEEWLVGQSLIKVVVPIFVMVGLFSCLSKTNLRKSAIAVIMGCNIYAFIESIASIIAYNFFKILPEDILNGVLISIIVVLFMVILGLGIIALLKKFNWQVYNLAKVADNNRENRPILTALLLLVGFPFLVYCFVIWLTVYHAGLMVYLAELANLNIENADNIIANIAKLISNVVFILNISNVIFLVYFFATCFAMKRFDLTLEKSYKYKADRGAVKLLSRVFETKFEAKEAYVKQMIPISLVPITQLYLFYEIQYALAQEKQVDFVLLTSNLSGLEAYVDDDFIWMLERLYENAFEAVESVELKEIYSEIAKDEDGGFSFVIKNNGDVLPKGSQLHPFEFGYTTRNSPRRGSSLYMVKKLIDFYGGSIDLRGTDGYTQVIIKLPFKETYRPEQPKRPVLRVVKGD